MTKQKFTAKPELVFWFDAPPRAGAGAFCHVAQAWGGKVYYMCAAPLRVERTVGGWSNCDHGNAVITILNEKPNPIQFVIDFVTEYPQAIHVCNGFRGHTEKYIKGILLRIPGSRIAMWSERPGVYGSLFKKTIKTLGLPILHRYYALRYGSKIQVFLPLGMLGVITFGRFGWSQERLFPFMYDPQIPKYLPNDSPRLPEKPLRFLYVGRFARSTKGIDVLIHAINKLTGDDWHLDVVGGYGEFKDFTINWAAKHPNVTYCGIWPSNEICQRITQYDVCLVPSRFDGWNVVINESLHAGVGVIATEESVSSELIKASGAGLVIPADNIDALQRAIQSVIEDPSLVKIWKDKAKAYSSRITSESVGCYLMDVLEYTFLDPSQQRPECPWL